MTFTLEKKGIKKGPIPSFLGGTLHPDILRDTDCGELGCFFFRLLIHTYVYIDYSTETRGQVIWRTCSHFVICQSIGIVDLRQIFAIYRSTSMVDLRQQFASYQSINMVDLRQCFALYQSIDLRQLFSM